MKKIVVTSIAALAVASTLMAAVNSGQCVGCHGTNFEKKALGQSVVVADQTHAQIATELKGYKDTSGFGHSPSKGVMANQVKKYSDADLEAFSKTVGN